VTSYGRVRTDFGGAGYRADLSTYHRDPVTGNYLYSDSERRGNLVWSRGSFCFDTSDNWFGPPSINVGTIKVLNDVKVYKDHDFLLDFRSWRYHLFGSGVWKLLQPFNGAINIDSLHGTNVGNGPWWLASKFMEPSTVGSSLPWMHMDHSMDHVPAPILPTNPVTALLGRTDPAKPGVDIPAFRRGVA
jgi:hypothetical protein